MSEFSKIQNKLLHDEKIDIITSAILTADILNGYDKEIKEAILDWADEKDVEGVELEGITVADMKDEIGCSSFQALCIMNSLKKNPDSFADAVFVMWKDEIL